MSLSDIIPAILALPRTEKFKLMRMLLDDLAGEGLLMGLELGQEFPLYTPQLAPGAAAQLAALLREQEKLT